MENEKNQEIYFIDKQIAELFEKRILLISKEAKENSQNNFLLQNSVRERETIAKLTISKQEELAEHTKMLLNTVFELSRLYTEKENTKESKISESIKYALENTPSVFPKSAVVACQGTEGAYSQFACEKLFSRPSIMYFRDFENVFNAVEEGLCKYGILPLENSLHGSVTEVYDLMKKNRFHIARTVKIKINHSLLAKKGAKITDIKEIYSHSQALSQCGDFLKNLNVNILECKNTAVAAELVSKSDRTDIASISDPRCGELYGLSVLKSDIQNNANNYTRFICISKELEIYPGSDKISFMFSTPHKPGALYGIMSKFASLGVNLTKLESRPIPERDFEYMFYAELETSLYSPEIINLISRLDNAPELFVFLGSYSES